MIKVNWENAKIRRNEGILSFFFLAMTLIFIVIGIIIGKDSDIVAIIGILIAVFMLLIGHLYWHKEVGNNYDIEKQD